MSKKQICIPSADLLKSVDKALSALEESRKQAKRQARSDKKAIAALLDLEAQIEDASSCKRRKVKKKKTGKKTKSPKTQVSELELVTAADIDEPLLSLTTLENTLDEPRNGTADGLHMISGIGPKLEELLHGLGIFHFDQIANWTQTEINWVDDYLEFSGRIERDNWVEQAKALAIGGRDEYVKVFGKEPR